MKSLRLLPLIAVMLILLCAGCSTKSKKTGPGGLTEEELAAQREARFGSGEIPSAEGEGPFRDIHFDFDSAAISAEARGDLDYNANVLRQYPELRVVLEGHCDERGTAEYNMALGAERSRATRQAMLALGVSADRIDTISYGEEVPLDPNHDDVAWSKNRRVHFSPLGEQNQAQ